MEQDHLEIYKEAYDRASSSRMLFESFIQGVYNN